MEMQVVTHEIPLPGHVAPEAVEQAIDEAIAYSALQATLKGSLKQYPGCIHWHLKAGRAAGTLEMTFWPVQRRAWFSVQNGRQAAWIEAAQRQLGDLLQQRLSQIDPLA